MGSAPHRRGDGSVLGFGKSGLVAALWPSDDVVREGSAHGRSRGSVRQARLRQLRDRPGSGGHRRGRDQEGRGVGHPRRGGGGPPQVDQRCLRRISRPDRRGEPGHPGQPVRARSPADRSHAPGPTRTTSWRARPGRRIGHWRNRPSGLNPVAKDLLALAGAPAARRRVRELQRSPEDDRRLRLRREDRPQRARCRNLEVAGERHGQDRRVARSTQGQQPRAADPQPRADGRHSRSDPAGSGPRPQHGWHHPDELLQGR